jgi:hypothetical protein
MRSKGVQEESLKVRGIKITSGIIVGRNAEFKPPIANVEENKNDACPAVWIGLQPE